MNEIRQWEFISMYDICTQYCSIVYTYDYIQIIFSLWTDPWRKRAWWKSQRHQVLENGRSISSYWKKPTYNSQERTNLDWSCTSGIIQTESWSLSQILKTLRCWQYFWLDNWIRNPPTPALIKRRRNPPRLQRCVPCQVSDRDFASFFFWFSVLCVAGF